MAAKGQASRRDYVPVGPIRRVLQEELDRRNASYNERSSGNRAALSEVTPTSSLAFDIFGDDGARASGLRRIYSWLHQNDWISFDHADLVLTRLGLADLWHTDPELNEIWESDAMVHADRFDALRAARTAA